MRKSIFEIENRINITDEYERLINGLFEQDSLIYNSYYMNLYDFINDEVFPQWKYRGTFTNIYEFLENLGINIENACDIDEESFLNFLEFLLNIWNIAKQTIDFNRIKKIKRIQFNIIDHNIPIILEKMNYKSVFIDDKIIIIKRDADVDSILNNVPENISLLLLEYNDIRNHKIGDKKLIIKELDLYIEKDKKRLKSLDSGLYDSIQTIVNEMGINHPISDKFSDLTEENLINWYDKCFKMIIHLLRYKEINKYKEERKKLVNEK